MRNPTRIALGLVAGLAIASCGQKRDLKSVASEEPQKLADLILAPTSQLYSERGYGKYRFGSSLPELYRKKTLSPYCSRLESAKDAEGHRIYFSSKAEVVGFCSKHYKDVARYEAMIQQKFGTPHSGHMWMNSQRAVTTTRYWMLLPATIVYVSKQEYSGYADGIRFWVFDREFVVDALRQHVRNLWDALDKLPLATPGPEMTGALKTAGLEKIAKYQEFDKEAPLAGAMVLDFAKIGDHPTHPLFTEGALGSLVEDVVYVNAFTQFFPPAVGRPRKDRSRIFSDTVTRWAANNGWDVEMIESIKSVYLLRAHDEGGL